MFDKLRAAFREAAENFKEELSRDEVPEAVDRLVKGMRDEVIEAKARLADLEKAIARARAEAGREKAELETCRRRERMAREIGDDETADLAAEYAEKHERRKTVLERKATALEEELRLRRAEIGEMIATLKKTRKERESLAAKAGRSSARESIRGAGDLFDELERMAEEIDSGEMRREAEREVERSMRREESDYHIDLDAPPRPEVDIDQRLEELKRRMGRE